MSKKAKPSKTTNRLHFNDLDPLRFEDLCLNLVYAIQPWLDIRHYGRAGSEQGVDIFAVEQLGGGKQRRWCVQCKRYAKVSIGDLRAAVDKVTKGQAPPDVFLAVVSCDVSRKTHEAFLGYTGKQGIGQALLWTQSILEAKLYKDRPDLLFSYFEISSARKQASRAAGVRRNLAMKRRMHRDFITKNVDWERARKRPYSKFVSSKMIVRSIDDTSYPEIDENDGVGISSWFKIEPFDFYHNGFEVILGMAPGIMRKEQPQHWTVVEYEALFDSALFAPINLFILGRIPYRNIVDYDLEGDEYDNIPHVYCDFSCAGSPYENIQYALPSEDMCFHMSAFPHASYKELCGGTGDTSHEKISKQKLEEEMSARQK